MNKRPLTPGERRIYEFLVDFRRTNGFMPTFREMQRHFGYKSVSTIRQYIDVLVNKGYVAHAPRAPNDTSYTPRTLKFVDDILGIHTIYYEDLTNAIKELRNKGKVVPVELAIDLLSQLQIKIDKRFKNKNFKAVLDRPNFQLEQLIQQTNSPILELHKNDLEYYQYHPLRDKCCICHKMKPRLKYKRVVNGKEEEVLFHVRCAEQYLKDGKFSKEEREAIHAQPPASTADGASST